ncbi:MAG: transcription elongation factor GreA [Clostridia bacterium]|nr:transcription elongation factor GreA [Clostridia bacterium]
MENEIYLTKDGYKALQEKLDYLKSTKREEVSKKIGIAREFGDLSENSEYDAAKEEQAQIEAEIAEIENKLRFGKIINQKKLDTSKVNAGCYVKLKDLDFDDEFEYQIVGSTESDPSKGIISNESPVGQALLGKKVGETVQIVLPQNNNATIRLKVLDIRA